MTISVIGFAGFAGRLAIGTVSDRLGRARTLGLCLFLQALSFLGFAISTGLGLLYSAAAVFGFSYGGVTAVFPAIVGDFFGRIAIGAIVGFIFALAGSHLRRSVRSSPATSTMPPGAITPPSC
jgi:OFA family oxalate/formate antiporter-like MFS transporter